MMRVAALALLVGSQAGFVATPYAQAAPHPLRRSIYGEGSGSEGAGGEGGYDYVDEAEGDDGEADYVTEGEGDDGEGDYVTEGEGDEGEGDYVTEGEGDEGEGDYVTYRLVFSPFHHMLRSILGRFHAASDNDNSSPAEVDDEYDDVDYASDNVEANEANDDDEPRQYAQLRRHPQGKEGYSEDQEDDQAEESVQYQRRSEGQEGYSEDQEDDEAGESVQYGDDSEGEEDYPQADSYDDGADAAEESGSEALEESDCTLCQQRIAKLLSATMSKVVALEERVEQLLGYVKVQAMKERFQNFKLDLLKERLQQLVGFRGSDQDQPQPLRIE